MSRPLFPYKRRGQKAAVQQPLTTHTHTHRHEHTRTHTLMHMLYLCAVQVQSIRTVYVIVRTLAHVDVYEYVHQKQTIFLTSLTSSPIDVRFFFVTCVAFLFAFNQPVHRSSFIVVVALFLPHTFFIYTIYYLFFLPINKKAERFLFYSFIFLYTN